MMHDAGDDRLASKRVVLLGAGHTNAHIIRMWGMNPIPDTELVCVSDHAVATYSGMLPAVLAGQVPRSEMEIDLVRLCASKSVRLITDSVTGFDKKNQLLHFAERPSLPFDVLSVGIGSVPTTEGVREEGDSLLRIKPMQTFLERLGLAVDAAVRRVKLQTENAGDTRSLRVLIAGSGVAGVEIAFCLPEYLRQKTSLPFSLHVVSRSPQILDGVIPSMRKRVHDELHRREVIVQTGKTILSVSKQNVELNDGAVIKSDLVIWATGAAAPPLLSKLELAVDERGFLATDATLRSTSGVPVFAVGDSGTITTEKLPKAGVYAVRQGPILWDNIKASLGGEPLARYEPQRSFLKLLNTGDGKAIGEWKGFSFAGRWAMKWKDRIDRRFMTMYRVADIEDASADAMQCRGCGCKLGGEVLEGALAGTDSSQPLLRPEQLDDAAVIDVGHGQVVASTDFFTNPVDDPWLFGRIAALHSASDLVAMGATVNAALANVVLPDGKPAAQRQALNDLLAGAKSEFEAMGAKVVGGHTIVGPRWEVGFTVIGEPQTHGSLLRKGNLSSGDRLYVTKPLGIGVLLAAHMRSQCKADDYSVLMDTILQRQHSLIGMVSELHVTAGTDITGFGLAGHLLEMLTASDKNATLQLDRLPLLSGAVTAIENGIESSLAPQNRYVECQIEVGDETRARAEFSLLFDPQTCGGLLLGVSAETASCFEQSAAEFGVTAIAIGEVCDRLPDTPFLSVV